MEAAGDHEEGRATTQAQALDMVEVKKEIAAQQGKEDPPAA
jgi:hypothetical protein